MRPNSSWFIFGLHSGVSLSASKSESQKVSRFSIEEWPLLADDWYNCGGKLELDATASFVLAVILDAILVESVPFDVDVEVVAMEAVAIPTLPPTSFIDNPGLSSDEL